VAHTALAPSDTAISPPIGGATDSGSLGRANGLNDVECAVVQLSREDPLFSLDDRRSALDRMATVFGVRPPNTLADPRLEALRRHAVLLRLRGMASETEMARFIAAGYSVQQSAAIERMVAPWRSQSDRDIHRSAWLVPGVAAFLACWVVAAALDERPMGLAIAGLSVITIAPFILPNRRRG
jgi:hypothetical protein